MSEPVAITLHELGTESANGVGPTRTNAADRYLAKLLLEVTEVAAVSVTFSIETASADNPAGWTALVTTSPALTAPAVQSLVVTGCKAFLRVKHTLTNTPGSVRYALSGYTHRTYASPLDMANLSLPPSMLSAIPLPDQAEACLAATDEANSYLGRTKDLPLASWGYALRMHVANMAAYHAMKRRGFNPDNDPLLRLMYTDALKWLEGTGAANDPTIIDSTPTAGPSAAYVITRPARGWGRW